MSSDGKLIFDPNTGKLMRHPVSGKLVYQVDHANYISIGVSPQTAANAIERTLTLITRHSPAPIMNPSVDIGLNIKNVWSLEEASKTVLKTAFTDGVASTLHTFTRLGSSSPYFAEDFIITNTVGFGGSAAHAYISATPLPSLALTVNSSIPASPIFWDNSPHYLNVYGVYSVAASAPPSSVSYYSIDTGNRKIYAHVLLDFAFTSFYYEGGGGANFPNVQYAGGGAVIEITDQAGLTGAGTVHCTGAVSPYAPYMFFDVAVDVSIAPA